MKESENPALLFLSARKTTIVLLLITLVLIICDVFRWYLKHNQPGLENLNTFLENTFQITSENNASTLFSVFLLTTAGLLLLLVARGASQFKFAWYFLGCGFLFLGLDEGVQIHETISRVMRQQVTIEGNLSYGTWVIPYLIIALVLGFVYWKFVIHLPIVTRWIFIVAGCVYVGGAAGFEIIEGYLYTSQGETGLYKFFHWSQEIVEMVGVIMFIYGLIDYLAKKRTTVEFT